MRAIWISLILMVQLWGNPTILERNGWNLISVCQDMNMNEVNMTNIQEIQNQEGKSIYTGEWAEYSNLKKLEAGYGYWIKGDAGVTFDSGEANSTLKMPLKRTGWNLMASCEEIDKADIDMTDIDEIQAQNGHTLYTGDNAQYSNLDRLLNGYGYWVKGDKGTLFQARANLDVPNDNNNSNTCSTSIPIIDDSNFSDTPPADNIAYSQKGETVKDIEKAFNNARSNDPSISKLLVMPSQDKWDSMTIQEKALFLLNSERYDRGIKPFEGISSDVVTVAQNYAEFLYANGKFGHNEDGTPLERLDRVSAIKDNKDFLGFAENIYASAGSNDFTQNPIAKAIYNWIYQDKDSSWGHRKFCLVNKLNDNSGKSGEEGLIGFGLKQGEDYAVYPNFKSTIVVFNAFDPASSWNHDTTIKLPCSENNSTTPPINLKDIDIAHKYGKATQGTDSSYYYYQPAYNAIDNNDSTINHTSGGKNGKNWLQIELPHNTKISKIVLQNGNGSGLAYRLTNAKVYISDSPYGGTVDENDLVNTLQATNSEQIIEFTTPKSGSYLLIKGEQREQDDRHLHLRKVEVYGELPPTPIFHGIKDEYFVKETSLTGAIVTRVEAEDFQGDRLFYSIVGDVPFVIDNDGNIRVNGLLDYGSYSFNVVVSDGTNSRTTSITIKANNDGVPENIAHKFGVATQGDTWDNRYARYAIDNNISTYNHANDVVPNNWWQLQLPKGTKIEKIVIHNSTYRSYRLKNAKMYLNDSSHTIASRDMGTLDKTLTADKVQTFTYDPPIEKEFILIQGNLLDGASKSLHIGEVEVYGITPATPALSQKEYLLGLKPYSPIGTVVGKVKAIDYQNDNLVYKIIGQVPFSIDNNGTVRLTEEINHNAIQSYDFSVIVSDGDTNITAPVSVKLLNGNGVKVERWNGISGTAVNDLFNNAHYKDKADETRVINSFDYNENLKNNFGERLTATLQVKESGKYIFAIVGDDGTELNLNGKKIAYRTSWSSYQNWNAAGKSDPIYLEEGNLYSLEAFLKEAGGAEHISVGWKRVGDSEFTIIPASQLYQGILNSENVKPILHEHKTEYLIKGTTSTGTTIATIGASDLQGDTLSYSIVGDVPFSVNSNGEISVSGSFDRLSYTFDVEVSDGVNVVTTTITVNVTSSTSVEDVLNSGDVVKTHITQEELIQATLDEIEAIKTFMQDVKVKIFNLNSDGTAKADGSSLTSIDWTPTHDASIILPTLGKNSAFLYTNAVETDGYTIYHKPMGTLGEKDSGRYVVFGSNPLRNDVNDEMNQVLENTISWLTKRDDLKTAPFKVVIAHLDESYWFHDESKTREWLDTHYTNQVTYNSENSCDGVALSGCLDNNPDLLIISQVSNSDDNITQIINTVNQALVNGTPVLYVHHDGNQKVLGKALFSSVFDMSYSWDNIWKKLKIEGYNPTIDMGVIPSNIEKIKRLFTHFKGNDYAFDWSVCKDDDKVGSQYDDCSDVVGLNSEFQEGATEARNIINALDYAKKDIFKESGYRFQKLLVLTADKFRQSVHYPMDKVTTDDNEFMKSYYADHVIYNFRKVNPVQPDMGNFSSSDFSKIIPTTRVVNVQSKRKFKATGAYALPGQTVKVTRSDSSDLTVKVFINSLRSGATHQYQKNAYNRPKYLQTPHFEIKSGESIELTSPYGGPIQLEFSKNDLPVKITFENVGEHPFWASSTDNDSFEQKLNAGNYNWAEIATAGFTVHSKLDKMRQSVSDMRWGGTAEGLANAVVKYTSNYPHVLAGFKGNGVDVVPEIHDWAQERNITIETIDIMKHMNADQATCGYGCSGNPYDAYWSFNPIGHGDIHEMGHSMQMMRFEGFPNHAATNTFSYYTKLRYFENTGEYGDCQRLPFKKVFDTVQASVNQNDPKAYLQKELWDNTNWPEPYVLKINAMMHAQKLGKVQKGWHVLARVHILQREMRRAKKDWEARKDLVGFSTYSLDEINAISNNDWLTIAYSYASELDLREYFDMMGIPFSQKAHDQIASFGFDKAPKSLFVSTDTGYCQTDDYGTLFDRPTLPIDGNTSYPY